MTSSPMLGASLQDGDVFRLMVENTRDYAIFMLDPSGRVASWNEGARRMKGYQSEEIIGRHFSVFYPPEAIEQDWPGTELELAARDGRFEDSGWRVRKDGSRFWANVVITAVRDESGRLVGFGKVSRDLTNRRNTELAIIESEERFRLLVESASDYAIFMLDPTGHVASWNVGAQRIKGYTAAEIIGRHFSVFYPADVVATGWPMYELREAERLGRFEDEGWRIRNDGTRFWANVVITAIRGSDGVLRGFGKVTRDMTERRAQEQRVQQLKVQLEHRVVELAAANRDLAQKSAENESFVYGVSHDLRTPLVNLQGFSQELTLASGELRRLLSSPAVPADVQQKALSMLNGELAESVGFMADAVRHLGNIVDGLLRLSRIGRVEYQFAPVDTGAVVAEIVAAMHSTISASGAQLHVEALPVVTADKSAIGQVFANIIGNAVKNLDERRPGVIEISASGDDPTVFAVRDNGVGIPTDYQSKIFQVAQHVHQRGARGEGMGLAIVRRIVERHGGRIWFESVPGVGTTFFFTVGRASAALQPPEGTGAE